MHCVKPSLPILVFLAGFGLSQAAYAADEASKDETSTSQEAQAESEVDLKESSEGTKTDAPAGIVKAVRGGKANALNKVLKLGDETSAKPAAWAGSTVTYSNFAKIQTTYDYNASRCSNAGTNPGQPVSIDADSCSETDLGNNYDPYYGMSVSLRPAWKLDNGINLSARFDVTGELTTPNATNRRVMMGDLSFSSSFGNLYTIPGADIGVSASTSVAFGTSPYSLAAGKIGGVSGSLTMSRAFEVLEGLNVSYTLSTGHDVYTHSSGSTLSHVLLTDCSSDGDNTDDRTPDCDGEQEIYNGVPNKWMGLSQTLSASLKLTEMFSLSAYYLAAYGFQYDTVDNSEISNGVEDPTTINFSNGAGFTLSAAVLPYLSIRSGVRSNHPQLDPNSQYYTPLFNRFAQWFLDVTLVPASLAAEL